MGTGIAGTSFTREQRQRHREKVRACLDVFERMLEANAFEFDQALTGMEIELNIVDDEHRPSMDNTTALAVIDDPDYQAELARFNLEFNVPPTALGDRRLLELEEQLRLSLNRAAERCASTGQHIVMTGILATVGLEHFAGDWMTPNARYQALNEAVLAARGENLRLDLDGPAGESLHTVVTSLAPESVCTSMQLHVQVRPAEFAAHWNAAQVLAGPQVALGANSPYAFGRELGAENRIPVFAQTVDPRPVEYLNQGVRPRVFFGEKWITSIFDLFEENARWFPALLPETTDEDPAAVLASGGTPELAEMRLHNGTIYRWNRPVYDVSGGRAHLRLENRVLPAGPTILDALANAAFYHGTLRALASQERPVWSSLAFATAAANFRTGAHRGLAAELFWPGRGEMSIRDLTLRLLLPLAADGLDAWGVDPSARDRYLGVIEGRCTTGMNGAAWQVRCVRRLEERGLSRADALRAMTGAYIERMHANEPVHTWTLP